MIPGLVDARSSLFLSEADLSGSGAADQGVLDAADLFRDEAAKVLAQGVTTLYLSPGSRGAVCGVGAVVKLRNTAAGSGEVRARVLAPTAALDLTIGLSANGRSTSLERLNSYEALRSLFKSAEQYEKSFERYNRDLKAYEKLPPAPKPAPGASPSASPPAQKPARPKRVPAQETVLSAIKGTIPVRIEAHRVDDILNALRLAEEFHLKAVLVSATESRSLAGEIARRAIPVIWGPTLDGSPRLETREHRPETAADLARAGVKLALTPNSRSGLGSRFLRENAALAVSYGLTADQALRAITLDAARALGVADRVGSIEPGKDADLVVLSTPAFDGSSRVERVFVDGQEVVPARALVSEHRAAARQASSKGGRALDE